MSIAEEKTIIDDTRKQLNSSGTADPTLALKATDDSASYTNMQSLLDSQNLQSMEDSILHK